MAFGYASQPTRKYTFGVRERMASTGEPFPGHALAIDQLHKAHRYRNNLVEIERTRREESAKVLGELETRLAEMEARIAELDGEVKTMVVCLKANNIEKRGKVSDKELAKRIGTRRKELKTLRQEYREAKRAAYQNPANGAERVALNERAGAAVAAARDEARRDGLSWPTANHVMGRVKRTGPPPRFHRFDGSGTLAFQVQRKADRDADRVPVLDADGNPKIHPRSHKPMTRPVSYDTFGVAEMSEPNTLARIEPHADGNPRHAYVHFRLGSNEDGSPVWAVFEAKLHRPIPPDGEIKWVYLTRQRIGGNSEWQVQFDVAMAEWEHPHERAAAGVVGVAFGWTMTPAGLRVASWVGSDGAGGEVVIPHAKLTAWRQVEELQRVRDEMLDRHKTILLDWLHAVGDDATNQFMAQAFAQQGIHAAKKDGDRRVNHRVAIRQWRSPQKMARLLLWWRGNRVPGDEAVFAQLEGELVKGRRGKRDRYTGGRKQDRHLWDWQENLRAKVRGWRQWYYRQVAIDLAKRYRTVAYAKIRWADAARNKATEDADRDVDKTNRGIAAVATLQNNLIDYAAGSVAVDPAGVAATCAACGCGVTADGPLVRCERCGGEPVDRMRNAARNVLRLGLRQAEGGGAARVA
jgi:hypothetical protein